MLRRLSIRDLAILDRLELELDDGFSVITGETGAGKSIIVDALDLISGGRADATIVRPGCERAEVSAEFDLTTLPALHDWLRTEELDEDGACLIRRSVRAEGGSRAWINGRAASLQQLKQLTEGLLEIHGQHEHQALLARPHQLALLDAYGQLAALREPVRAAAAELGRLRAEQRQASADPAELVAQRVELQTQIQTLEQLQPSVERIDQLDRDQRRLSHHESLLSGLSELSQALDGEDTGAVRSQLLRCEQEMTRLAAIDPSLTPSIRALEEARIGIEEVAREARNRLEDSELDPRQLAEVEAALSTLHAQARRHRVLVADLPGLLESLRERESELRARLDRLQRFAALETELLAGYRQHAGALGHARVEAAHALSIQVNALIAELGMGGGRFEVEFSPRLEEDAHADGAEQVEFLVSTNAGMPPRPLRKIASGGELARLSLAIKVATADVEDVPVLVFDEVDSGIGGPTAEIVGRKLRKLGKRRQVLSVTHLAQVAACAHHHLRASKTQRDDGTVGRLEHLEGASRREEVARMLGGIDLTSQSLAHADELIERAQANG